MGHNVSVLTSNVFDKRAFFDPLGGKFLPCDMEVVNRVKVFRFKSYSCLPFFLVEKLLSNLGFRKNPVYDAIYNFSFGPITLGMYRFILDSAKKYDLIHATAFPHTPFFIAFQASQKSGIPYVCTPAFHFEIPSFYNCFLFTILKKADAIIAATGAEKQRIVELGVNSNRVHVIPKGVEPKEWGNASGDRFRKRHGVEDKPIILFAGSKSEEKGVFEVLHAMKYVQKRMKDVVLVTMGEASIKWEREKNKTNVRLYDLHYVTDREKMDAFDACDIFVMPSKVDSFGIAYLEAWICGKPVIGARIGSTPEVVRDGVDGLQVTLGDAKDLARKILFLLKRPQLRRSMGFAGKERTLEYFTWQRVAEQIDEVYENIAVF